MSIIWLQDIKPEHDLVGGKAQAIAKLSKAGFPVPEGFVITEKAFEIKQEEFVLSNTQDTKQTSPNLQLKSSSKVTLRTALSKLIPNHQLVAVRSSAVGEDGDRLSFAGQFKSFLNVAFQEIENRIIEVWESAKNQESFTYQQSQTVHTQIQKQSMAVLVQPMIAADFAGVAFSADPVSGQQNVVLINAVKGLGDRLMAGEITGQHYKINRFDQVAESPTEQPLLTQIQLLEIADLVRKVAQYFGKPQDIEWAIANDQLYLLQARPITTLDNFADPEGIFQLWDNSNIVESYSGITTPLTFSFARQAYTEVYQQFCRFMGVSDQIVTANKNVFRNMIGFVQGRIYYNLLNWYRVLAMLPAAKLNSRFMEQMMGVKEGLPEAIITEIQAGVQSKTWGDRWQIGKTFFSLIRNFFTLETRIQAYYQRINEALLLQDTKDRPANMDRWRTDELANYYRSLEENLLAHWDAPLINDFFAMIFYGLLCRFTEKWCGDQTGSLQNALVADAGEIVSAEPLKRMQEMAMELSKEDVQILSQSDFEEIKKWLKTKPKFKQKYQDYLDKFGDRCLAELKLESPTLHDQPLLLLHSIAHMAQVDKRITEPLKQTSYQDAEKQAFTALKQNLIKKILFRWILNNARRLIRNRENLRFERTRVFGLARRIFLQLGKRFYQVKKLNQPEDIFYLEVEEILGYINGTSTCTNLKGLVALRHETFEKYRSEPKPGDRFSTRGMVYQGNNFQPTQTSNPTAIKDSYQGKSCATGRATGEVRVVLDPQEFLKHNEQNPKSGYILVAESTDPGWILLFPQAAGLLVERGSTLSHVAIVCRELGLPMITDLAGITQWLKDGDRVEIDGSTGKIYRLETEAIAAHES